MPSIVNSQNLPIKKYFFVLQVQRSFIYLRRFKIEKEKQM